MKDIKNFSELEKICGEKKICEFVQDLEADKLCINVQEVRNLIKNHLGVMKESLSRSLNFSSISVSGMSGKDSTKIIKRYNENKSPLNMLFGKVLAYAAAIAEENQRMGRIVACPTAGSCGILPAVIIAYAEELDISEEKQLDSLLIAGIIGKITAQKMPLSGAMAGCQAECGVGSAMAAAAVVELSGGNTAQIINAAALALKNSLGLVCDPVAGLVEVPCIKRNGFYAINALSASEMALSGVKSVIPIDEIIDAMKEIGQLMHSSLKESSEGGLARTPTALEIEENIQKF